MAFADEQESVAERRARQETSIQFDLQSVFEQLEIASFTVGGQTVVFPVMSVDEEGGNRIVERKRPYRDGAKLDDTGSEPKIWSFDVWFFNTIDEPGLEANGVPLYPYAMNELLEMFDVHETGDLQLPMQGRRRARAWKYRRREDAERRDGAVINFTFEEDNEDNVDFRSVQLPTPSAISKRLVATTTFDEQSAEVWDFNVREMNRLVSEIETTLRTPQTVRSDANLLAKQVQSAGDRVNKAFSKAGTDGRNVMASPRAHRVQRKVNEQQDLAARAALSSQGGRPQLISVIVSFDTSIMELAALLGQSYEALLAANTQLENPAYIRRGTVVRVYPLTNA